jgi:nucleotide-binding universal stress UspA family protein
MTAPESLIPIVPASPGADSFVGPFDTVLSACPIPAIDDCASPVAGAVARLTGARLVAACALPEPSLEVDGDIRHAGCDARSLRLGQALALPAGARAKAIIRMAREVRAVLLALAAPHLRGSERIPDLVRALLDDGVAVLVVPAGDHRSWRPARIGLGYDGSPPADAALAIARRLVEAGRGEVGRLDIAYVDDSTSASYESDGEVIASRRGAVIEWWLGDLVEHLPAHVRPLRLIGDPAVELAELSDDLDLLVIGTRGRASLRRAFTGSVSRGLIARTRCPLLVVPPRLAARERQTPTRAAACTAATREI